MREFKSLIFIFILSISIIGCDSSNDSSFTETVVNNDNLRSYERASVTFSSEVVDMTFEDNSTAYVAGHNGGIYIISDIDTNESTDITLSQTISTATLVHHVIKDSSVDMLYAAAQTGGIKSYSFDSSDLNSTAQLLWTNTDALQAMHIVQISSNYLAVADGDNGVRLFHIDTSSGRFTLEQTISTGGFTNEVNLDSSTLYASVEGVGVVAIDVSGYSISPATSSASISSTYSSSYKTHASLVTDDLLVMANREDGVAIYDKNSTTLLSTIGTNHEALDVASYGSHYIVVADNEAGVTFIDITDSSNPSIDSTALTGGSNDKYAHSIKVDGDYAYVADGPNGLRIISILDVIQVVY